MRWSTVLPLVVAATLAACGPRQLSQQERTVAEQRLDAQVKLWERAVNSLKPDSMAMVYDHSPDFTAGWGDGRRTRGWEQESQAQRDFIARTKAFNFDLQDPVTEVLNREVAVTTFRYSADVTDSLTGRALYPGQGTMVWVKDPADQTWKIRALQMSRTPPPAQAGGRRR